jgi:hypothetical protein
MRFDKLSKLVLTQVRSFNMLAEVEAARKTEIETLVNGTWKHDANDEVNV